MASFLTIPFELQQHILNDALSHDLCRIELVIALHYIEEQQPVARFGSLATNLVLAIPHLKDRVIDICAARLAQRELELAAFDQSCASIAAARQRVRRDKCNCYYQQVQYGWNSDVSEDERQDETELVKCSWCCDGDIEAEDRLEAAGVPWESCDELKYLVRSLKKLFLGAEESKTTGRAVRGRRYKV